jgi:hypothetical protein
MQTRIVFPLLGAALLACALPLPAQDQPSDQSKTYTLEAKYAVGDLLTYKMQMNLTIEITAASGQSPFPGGEVTMNALMRMKTTGIKPDGTAVLSTQMQDAEMTFMGSTMPMPQSPPMVMEADRRGMMKMRNLEKMPGGAMLGQMMNFNQMPGMGVVLPDHPVRIGDSWEAEIPYFTTTTEKAKVVCTLLAVEQIGGQETLKIKQVMTVPFVMSIGKNGQPTKDAAQAMMTMNGKFTVNGLYNILPENARLVRTVGDIIGGFAMELKGEAAQQSPFGSGMNMKMNGKLTMALTSAAKVAAAPTKPSAGAPVTRKVKITQGFPSEVWVSAAAQQFETLPIGRIPPINDPAPTTWGMSGMEILRVTQSIGATTPIMRTETFDARTVEILSRVQAPPLRLADIRVVSRSDRVFIIVGRYMLLEVMPEDARAQHTTRAALAEKWALSVRRVLPQVSPMPNRFGI